VLAATGWNATRGTIRIHDVAGLATFLDVAPSELRVDGISFEEDGDLISPWPITLAIARRAAGRDPHPVLGYVEKEEADARREATYGSWHRRRGAPDDHISAEISHLQVAVAGSARTRPGSRTWPPRARAGRSAEREVAPPNAQCQRRISRTAAKMS
jgi:hypothetical protein